MGKAEQLIVHARSLEKLVAIVYTLNLAAKMAGELHDLNPDLSPELLAVTEGISAGVEASSRAITFMDAQREVTSS